MNNKWLQILTVYYQFKKGKVIKYEWKSIYL